jgi:hypothetical protein
LERRTDEVAILEVEAVQLITCHLRVHDIFVDDKGRAFAAVGDTLANLAVERISIRLRRDRKRNSGGRVEGCIPDRAELAEEFEEFFGGDVVAVTR